MGTIRRSNVIRAAKSWADDGYTEGENNWTIFSQILDDCDYYAPQKKQGQPWCHNFVNCMFLISAEPKDREDTEKKYDAQNYLFQPSKNNLSCGCTYGAGYFRENNSFYPVSEAEIGDIIYFGKRGNESHVGIIYDIKDGRVYTVEGNKGDKVAYGDYSMNYKQISGVGRVAFDDYYDDLDGIEDDKPSDPIEDSVPEEPKPEPAPAPEPKGEKYIVTNVSSWLNVRNGCGKDYPVVDKLYNGEEVTVYETKDGWARISNDMDLWVSMEYLKKI